MSAGDSLGIIGAGTFGTALAYLVGSAGRNVVLWSTTAEVVDEINEQHTNEGRLSGVALPETVSAVHDPGELADKARFLMIAVTSTELRVRAAMLGDVVDGRHLVVHAVGGLHADGDRRMSEILTEEMPVLRVGALAGPAMPHDLVEGRFSSMVCASAFDEVAVEARRLLGVPPKLRMYRGRDLIGVELAAALAEAYTVALGVADGLGTGIGARAVLVTRAVAEASRLGCAAGAEERTFSGLAGLGNLLVRSSTESGRQSPSYRFGLALATGDSEDVGKTPEGKRSAAAGVRLARSLGLRAPVLEATAALIAGELSAAEAAAKAADTVAMEE